MSAGRLAIAIFQLQKPALRRQLAALEEPADALVVDVAGRPEEIIATIRQRLRP